jgi:hypothetical protein
LSQPYFIVYCKSIALVNNNMFIFQVCKA